MSHYFGLSSISIVFFITFSIQSYENLLLKPFKDGVNGFPLTSRGLQELQNVFNADIFIETGTCAGETASCAAPYFKHVYTVEKLESFYVRSARRIQYHSNVRIYYDDSHQFLARILPTINGKILFWLDAHTDTYAPLLQELHAIRCAGIKDGVILIDDIRICGLYQWPSLSELVKAIYAINPQYDCLVVGDILFAYIPNKTIQPSAVLKACSLSRLYDEKCRNCTNEELIQAEVDIIGAASGIEQETIKQLATLEGYAHDAHHLLWYALVLYKNKRYKEAAYYFKKSMEGEHGITHARIKAYYDQAISAAALEVNVPITIVNSIYKNQG